MARKQQAEQPGQLVQLLHCSRVLADNPLGDPHQRTLSVWLPPGYERRRRGLPVLFDLVGYTGSGHSHTNWNNFAENVPERLDRLTASGKLPPCIVVFPDCFTALGGNQYINSSAIGRYADYLTQELIPLIDTEFKTLADRAHRGCFGKSSGGYGALVHGMRYSKYWGGVASHSGDSYFDFVYRADWPQVLTHLGSYARPAGKPGKPLPPRSATAAGLLHKGMDDGRIARFLEAVWANERPSGADITTLMLLAMAATYDPDPKAPNGFRLPFHLDSGELLKGRWDRWLAQDPIHLAKDYRSELKSLKLLYFDCGWRDQYQIHFGNRQLASTLQRFNVPHRYEEFDGTHSGVDHRMDVSLPLLARALS